MRVGKIFPAFRIACIKHCPVGKNDANRFEHAVAVGMRAAIHARSVVHHDSSYHRRIFRCRIGRECFPVWLQNLIHAIADNSRLHGDCRGICRYRVFFPILTGHDKNRIAYRLPRQARAGGTKRDRQMQPIGSCQQFRNLFFRFRTNDNSRYFPIETGVGAPCKATQVVGINPVLRNKCPNFVQIRLIGFVHILLV